MIDNKIIRSRLAWLLYIAVIVFFVAFALGMAFGWSVGLGQLLLSLFLLGSLASTFIAKPQTITINDEKITVGKGIITDSEVKVPEIHSCEYKFFYFGTSNERGAHAGPIFFTFVFKEKDRKLPLGIVSEHGVVIQRFGRLRSERRTLFGTLLTIVNKNPSIVINPNTKSLLEKLSS